jgi:membrane associated rhomboid family serine protease
VLGRARIVLLFGLSSALGILVSSLSDPTRTSIGASAGALGMIGALLAMNLHRGRDEVPSRVLLSWPLLITLGALMVSDEVSRWAEIDHTAHVGGLLTGLALCRLMLRGERLANPGTSERSLTVFACMLGASYLFVFGKVLVAAFSGLG